MEEDRMPKKIFTQELEGTRRRETPRKRWREWRRIGCPKRSSLKNSKGRDEEEDPGKYGETGGG
jgi:hypothetical protein